MKDFLWTVVLLIVFLSSGVSIAESKEVVFTESQKEVLYNSCGVSYQYFIPGIHDVYTKEEACHLIAAIAWQESSAGLLLGSGPDHGIFQINENTALVKSIRTGNEGITKDEIIEWLGHFDINKLFMIDELSYWMNKRDGDIVKALSSYNAGWRWENGKRYAEEVLNKKRYLSENSSKLGLP